MVRWGGAADAWGQGEAYRGGTVPAASSGPFVGLARGMWEESTVGVWEESSLEI